jgi:ADP-heptose:LPS heptosyltransferase
MRSLQKDDFDCCFLLDQKTDLKKYFLCAKAAFPLRITYTNDSSPFFFNLTVRPLSDAKFIAQQNLSLARALGSAANIDSFHLETDLKSQDRVTRLLMDLGLQNTGSMIGVSSSLDSQVLENLLPLLIRQQKKALLFPPFSKNQIRESKFTSSFPGQVFTCPSLPLADSAALLKFCDYYISERTGLLYLSHYVGTPVVAIFDKKIDVDLWSVNSPSFQTILYEGNHKALAGEIMNRLKRIYDESRCK